MAGVEGAHRRHEADAGAALAAGSHVGAQLGDGADRPHAAASTRDAATSASNVSSRSGARSSIAARWRAIVVLVAAGDRAGQRVLGAVLGPVLERGAGERGEQLARSTPAVAASRSAAPSSVTRKFAAIEAAAW